ncbi:glyoxalase [Bacillus sp. sid0103]|nr:glyoxalase [Bacillus sp. sid0103]
MEQFSPEVNLGTPSLLFFTKDLDQMYKDFSDKNITVGEMVNVPEGRVFNFADDEGNYFAIVEKK